jgi:hypothetical protein
MIRKHLSGYAWVGRDERKLFAQREVLSGLGR